MGIEEEAPLVPTPEELEKRTRRHIRRPREQDSDAPIERQEDLKRWERDPGVGPRRSYK